eukprot:2979008-Amphidinium_carterae.1
MEISRNNCKSFCQRLETNARTTEKEKTNASDLYSGVALNKWRRVNSLSTRNVQLLSKLHNGWKTDKREPKKLADRYLELVTGFTCRGPVDVKRVTGCVASAHWRAFSPETCKCVTRACVVALCSTSERIPAVQGKRELG